MTKGYLQLYAFGCIHCMRCRSGSMPQWHTHTAYPLVVLPCKSSIFTKTTRETYCGGCWSRSQGLGLHRDAQEVSWMRHMLTNVRIHTYQSVHSQSKVQSSIAIARGTHVLLVTFTDMEASELGLTWQPMSAERWSRSCRLFGGGGRSTDHNTPTRLNELPVEIRRIHEIPLTMAAVAEREFGGT